MGLDSQAIKALPSIGRRKTMTRVSMRICLLCIFLVVSQQRSSGQQLHGSERAKPIRFISWGGIGGWNHKIAKAAAQIGIDTHRIPIGWTNPEGKHNYAGIEKAIRCVSEAGMNVILHFCNHWVPEWFKKEHPQAALRNAKRKTSWGSGPSYWYPYTIRYTIRNITSCLQYLKDKGLLSRVAGIEIGVHMEGQLSYMWGNVWAFDDYALASYRWFLIGRYRGNIGALNKEWGTGYRSFWEIEPPREYEESAECRVFTEFYRANLLEAAMRMAEEAEKVWKPKVWLWLSHGIEKRHRFTSARYPVFYMRKLREAGYATHVITDVLGHWGAPDVPKLKALGLTVIGEWAITPTAKEQRQQARMAWDAGCDGFFVGVLENLFEPDGTPTEVGRETAKIIRTWKAGKRP